LRSVLRRQSNVQVVLGEVTGFDLAARRVVLDGRTEDYDVLVVSTGSAYNYFGRSDWEALAPSLKTLEEATAIRTRILNAFEQAELASDPGAVRAWLTFVVIGGGPTGVELAGAIAEVARYTLNDDFKHIRPADAHVVLIEAEDRVLTSYPPSLSAHALNSLDHLGAEVRLDTRVTAIDEGGVTVSTALGEGRIEAHTVLWAAGVVGTPIGRTLAEAAGTSTAPGGRVTVTPELTLPGHPEVFVIGDLAFLEQDGEALPAFAPVAMQQGAHVAKAIAGRLTGEPDPAFRYKDRGSMATIGRSSAVADLGRIRLHGFLGWLAWLVIHLMMLVRFESKVAVFLQWVWTYFTHGRTARLITGSAAAPRPDQLSQPLDGD
jgi:NADH dehydrogenase